MTRSAGAAVLERSGCQLHYSWCGPAGRPWVVLTHGAGLDHGTLAPQVEALRADYQVLTWDLPGHGSSQPMGRDFGLHRAALDLLAILDQRGIEQAFFVGQSMGGDVTQELVFQAPRRALGMVLIGCLPITVGRPGRGDFWARVAAWKMRFVPLRRWRRQVSAAITVREDVRAAAERALARMSRRDLVATFAAIAAGVHDEPGYQEPCPLLLLVGREDQLGGGILQQRAEEWQRRSPRCVYQPVAGAGHMTHLDQPEVVNALVLEFLRQETTTAKEKGRS